MNRDTYDKMILLKLKGMAKAYKEYEVTLSQSSDTTKILKDLFVSFGF